MSIYLKRLGVAIGLAPAKWAVDILEDTDIAFAVGTLHRYSNEAEQAYLDSEGIMIDWRIDPTLPPPPPDPKSRPAGYLLYPHELENDPGIKGVITRQALYEDINAPRFSFDYPGRIISVDIVDGESWRRVFEMSRKGTTRFNRGGWALKLIKLSEETQRRVIHEYTMSIGSRYQDM